MTDGLTPADISAITGNCNNGMFGDGAWWIIVLFLFAFNGWGGGFGGRGGAGAQDNYVLASDFATIQRQLSDGFGSIDNALDRQNSGICDLGYTQAQLINQSNIQQMQSANALQAQIAQCCCDNRMAIADVNYNIATQGCAIGNAIQNSTRDIVDNANSNTRAILDALNAQAIAAKDAKIAEQTQQIFGLQLAASQQAQNAYLINELAPKLPVPSYSVPNPFASTCCGCN